MLLFYKSRKTAQRERDTHTEREPDRQTNQHLEKFDIDRESLTLTHHLSRQKIQRRGNHQRFSTTYVPIVIPCANIGTFLPSHFLFFACYCLLLLQRPSRMERACVDQVQENSCSPDPRSRFRLGSSVSTGLFQGLNIIDYPPAPPTHISHLEPTRATNKTPGPGTPSSTYINTLSSSHTSPSYLSTPVSRPQPQASPFPTLSDHVLNTSHWSDIPSRPAFELTPSSLPVDPSPDYPRQIYSPPLSTRSESATMSTAALQFDPGFSHFNMGSRSSFAWPGMSTTAS